ncbi:patatin-like phospholipase family protein [Streptomyces sp. NPDC007095]|uniref:patatin-like phospholipase family protein n=1 Tax=Streptomyces sp. NPDC007095 TaxID=3154482 RepID=UPI0033DA8D7D
MDPPSTGLRSLPRPVAVVVCAGGLLGAAHVGIGYALEHRGFVPDMIIGTSVGALNGAARPPTSTGPRRGWITCGPGCLAARSIRSAITCSHGPASSPIAACVG